MHLGNLSLAIEGDTFRVLPLYDMCCMGFAPRSGGEVPPYSFSPTAPRVNDDNNNFELIKIMARDFWERVTNDKRISIKFIRFLERGNPIDLM
jgi:hypothetical protein